MSCSVIMIVESQGAVSMRFISINSSRTSRGVRSRLLVQAGMPHSAGAVGAGGSIPRLVPLAMVMACAALVDHQSVLVRLKWQHSTPHCP